MSLFSGTLKARSTLFRIVATIVIFTAFTSFLGSDHFHGIEDERFDERFLNRFYFVMTTLSTVGYGDVSPKSPLAKGISIAMMMTLLTSAFF